VSYDVDDLRITQLVRPYVTPSTDILLGLGLAIAKRMMELQGGGLELNERAESGAEFIVTLPLQPPARDDVTES
jgi:signal transduction histidine kinase